VRLVPDAVLFDMDGLLVDSEPLWTVAEEELAADLGGVFGEELKARIAGTRLELAVPTILAFYGAPTSPEAVARTSAWLLERMVELFKAGPVVLPGVDALLADLRREGVPAALVSSSYRVLVDAVLGSGVGPFEVSVAGDEVAHGKPDPEPYATAARLLGVDPARCVVLEDTQAGALSGLAAGCAVVAVPSIPGMHVSPAPRLRELPSLVGVTAADLGAVLGERT
jgi:HAD superfamily hydrolase (TIGR01509 family)